MSSCAGSRSGFAAGIASEPSSGTARERPFCFPNGPSIAGAVVATSTGDGIEVGWTSWCDGSVCGPIPAVGATRPAIDSEYNHRPDSAVPAASSPALIRLTFDHACTNVKKEQREGRPWQNNGTSKDDGPEC